MSEGNGQLEKVQGKWFAELLRRAVDETDSFQDALECATLAIECQPMPDDAGLAFVEAKEDDTESLLLKVVKTFDEIEGERGPDYQRLFWNPEKKQVWWESFDGDDDKVVREIHKRLGQVSGVAKVLGESESSPPFNEGWFLLYPNKKSWTKKVQEEPIDAQLSFDIHNRKAQSILNRALAAARKISAAARTALAQALSLDSPTAIANAVVAFIGRYRIQLANLLTTTQLAAVLAGAREVARDLPMIPPPGFPPPPPTLEPKEARDLVEELAPMTDVERAERTIKLPPDQQQWLRSAMPARDWTPPEPPRVPPIAPGIPLEDQPEGVHFPVIEEAVRDLSSRGVMTRPAYDALDAAARAKAFTIAGVEARDTLEKVRDALADNVRQGVDYKEFATKVDRDDFLSDAHQELVFRQGIQSAFSDGQAKVLSHPFVRSGFPYCSYDSIHDDRVREEHKEVEHLGISGTNVFRSDDPVWKMLRPPWAYNCRCGWSPMTIRQAAEAGIEEAKQWLETGIEPSPPAFVSMPDFRPPPGFERAISNAPLSIKLSLISADEFVKQPSL